MVMLMPPYHGTTLRADDAGVRTYFQTVADAVDIPIMIQDAPISGVNLSVDLLARLARRSPRLTTSRPRCPALPTSCAR